ncbi:MAG: pantetheine-phosphate adenylyltransferase [Christensenellaceae bacterium]|nr:pantetheine-phosphate adenylyltransferase [Christensenellaceae bacterium]
MNNSCVYPGSFDPITYGHLDIITRSAKIFDKVYVAILNNTQKKGAFPTEKRVEMIQKSCKHLDNIVIEVFDGLLVDYVRKVKSNVIIRGLRAVSDFEAEFQMSHINLQIAPDIETLFLSTLPKYSYISSSMVRELAYFKGDFSYFVPECIVEDIKQQYK